jgi:hypothetical protein
MKTTPAHIVREYGPYDDKPGVHGVSFDGTRLWFASGDHLNAVDPASGELRRALAVQAHAGTAFDGRYLYQIADSRIQKIDPQACNTAASVRRAQLQAGVARMVQAGRQAHPCALPAGRTRHPWTARTGRAACP